MCKNDFQTVLNEFNILKNINHPNILRPIEIFNESMYFFVVCSRNGGTDLLQYLAQKPFITEENAIKITKQILSALEYLSVETEIVLRIL